MYNSYSPKSLVQNVISALVEDPTELRRAAAAASNAAVLPGTEAVDAVDALPASEGGQVAVQIDADELLKQAEEQAGDQVALLLSSLCLPCVFDIHYRVCAVSRLAGQQRVEQAGDVFPQKGKAFVMLMMVWLSRACASQLTICSVAVQRKFGDAHSICRRTSEVYGV